MPRQPLIRTHLYPYHVTARSNNKDWFELPMKEMWKICCDSLRLAYQKHPVDIIGFVLMSNHYHLLVKTPNCDIDKFMYEFNKNIGIEVRYKTNRINHTFGGRYKWCLIKSKRYFYNCYRYVYQNPLRAKITLFCEDYPYSSLYFKVNGFPFPIPLFDYLGFADEHKLMWLNQRVEEDEVQAIRNGMHRTVLTQLKSPMNYRPIPAVNIHLSARASI